MTRATHMLACLWGWVRAMIAGHRQQGDLDTIVARSDWAVKARLDLESRCITTFQDLFAPKSRRRRRTEIRLQASEVLAYRISDSNVKVHISLRTDSITLKMLANPNCGASLDIVKSEQPAVATTHHYSSLS